MKPKFSVETSYDEFMDEYDHYNVILRDVKPQSLSIKCPQCHVYCSMRLETYFMRSGWKFDIICTCPHCESSIFVQARYQEKRAENTLVETDATPKHVQPREDSSLIDAIYPLPNVSPLPEEVPHEYASDYIEASRVLYVSPKASAALSRRLLQRILRGAFDIKRATLAAEIEEFKELSDVPSYLKEAIDAVRSIGNFAAHPLKDTSTGEILDVEPGEAEWLLELLESFFDFAFVQPKKFATRKRNLNEKLKASGKKPMEE